MERRNSSIIAIENKKDRNKLLVYFDQAWGFWMFPACKMLDEDDIKEYLAGELCVQRGHIYFEFEGTGAETKFATAHNEERSYKYFMYIGHVYGISEEDFCVGDRKYRWMTIDEMLSDEATAKYNGYVVKMIRQMM